MSREPDRLLLSTEIAPWFRVDPKTIARWAAAGRFPKGVVLRTPGGAFRFRQSAILAMLEPQDEDSMTSHRADRPAETTPYPRSVTHVTGGQRVRPYIRQRRS